MNIQDNKQLVKQGYQMFKNKDIKGLLALFSDDIEWQGIESENIPFAGDFHGLEEVAQYFALLDQSQEAIQFTPQDFIAEGDRVVVSGTSSWSVKANGQRFDNPWVHLFTIRDGKVAKFQQYNDTAATEKAYTAASKTSAQKPGATLRH